jgi:hypothetical protein
MKNLSIARIDEIKKIMNFIHHEWRANHILSLNKKLFLFQHKNKKKLNFIISKNSSKKITGIIGFIKASKSKKADVWTTMWKSSKNSKDPMLGILLLNYLKKQGYRTIISSGIQFDTKKIYDYLGYSTGKMDHFFFPNINIKNPVIATYPKNIMLKKKFKKNKNYFIDKIDSEILRKKFPFKVYKSKIPFKDWEYFNDRYFLHPFFNYKMYGIFFKKKLVSILIFRETNINSSKVLRIIDFYGEEKTFKYLGEFFFNFLKEKNYEYIDLVCFGLQHKLIYSSGFIKIPQKSKKIIVPNYFNPLIRKNIALYFFVDKKKLHNVKIFKGDGDQDRPN